MTVLLIVICPMLLIKFVSNVDKRLQTTLHSVAVLKLTKSIRHPKRSADSGFTFELYFTLYSMILSCSVFDCIVLYIYFIQWLNQAHYELKKWKLTIFTLDRRTCRPGKKGYLVGQEMGVVGHIYHFHFWSSSNYRLPNLKFPWNE